MEDEDGGFVVVFSQSEIKFWTDNGSIIERNGEKYWNGAKVIENRYLGTGEKV